MTTSHKMTMFNARFNEYELTWTMICFPVILWKIWTLVLCQYHTLRMHRHCRPYCLLNTIHTHYVHALYLWLYTYITNVIPKHSAFFHQVDQLGTHYSMAALPSILHSRIATFCYKLWHSDISKKVKLDRSCLEEVEVIIIHRLP